MGWLLVIGVSIKAYRPSMSTSHEFEVLFDEVVVFAKDPLRTM